MEGSSPPPNLMLDILLQDAETIEEILEGKQALTDLNKLQRYLTQEEIQKNVQPSNSSLLEWVGCRGCSYSAFLTPSKNEIVGVDFYRNGSKLMSTRMGGRLIIHLDSKDNPSDVSAASQKHLKDPSSSVKSSPVINKRSIKFCSKTNTIHTFWNSGHQILGLEKFQAFLTYLMDFVKEREIQISPPSKIQKINLKNLGCSSPGPQTTQKFLNFANFCSQQRIKLLEVDAKFVDGFADLKPPWGTDGVDQSVVSLIGFTPDCLQFEWDKLESLYCRTFSRSSSCKMKYYYYFTSPAFPKLGSLTYQFNSTPRSEGEKKHDEFMFNILFSYKGNTCRGGVENLILKDICENLSGWHFYHISSIVKSLPNLKRLKMARWRVNEYDFDKLVNGLLQLEELCVQECPSFTDHVLIGKDPNNPLFHKLTQLKKLSLGADFSSNSPKVTDNALKIVFAKMKLKELELLNGTSHFVTAEGIAALKEGIFGTFVIKFICEGYSLEDVVSRRLNPGDKIISNSIESPLPVNLGKKRKIEEELAAKITKPCSVVVERLSSTFPQLLNSCSNNNQTPANLTSSSDKI